MGALRDQIKRELVRLIEEEMGVECADLSENSSFTDALNMSSMEALSIFIGVEEKYGVDFPYEFLEKADTLRDAVDLFENLISHRLNLNDTGN